MRTIPLLSVIPILCGTLAACGGQVVASPQTDASADTASDGTSVDLGPDAVDVRACSARGSCVLAHNGCCDPCGTPELANYTAVNKGRTEEWAKLTCPGGPGPCPDCVMRPNPNLFARCNTGTCEGFDIRNDPWSACASDDDCQLRWTGTCCEACGGPPDGLLALRKDAVSLLVNATCADPVPPCPPCVPTYPPGAKAWCDPSSRHCRVLLPR